ncbi:hypothetical protein C0J52_23966 [Blattella germanica]|nr:hypothetical protein C0J52_23966 [Blattella germanica]
MILMILNWTRSLLLVITSISSNIRAAEEYDFIIVGARAAGCLLANRLSENPKKSVLLIEAGREETFIQDIPALASLPQFTPANWGYQTEKLYTACLGAIDERCRWPRGKVLVGSTTINYMVYTRGNKADFDTWASLGNEGWSYDDVLPYFLKFEKMMIPKLANDTKYHSTKGELYINHPPYRSKSAELFVESANQTGRKIIDYNGEEQVVTYVVWNWSQKSPGRFRNPFTLDLKVGYNLQDHYGLGNIIFTVNSSIGIRFDNILQDLKEIGNFMISRNGF